MQSCVFTAFEDHAGVVDAMRFNTR